MRDLAKQENLTNAAKGNKSNLKLIQLDVNDERSVKSAVEQVVNEKGRIDVLVNNAGYGLAGAFEDTSLQEAKAQFETNLFGVIRVTQAVLPQMRKQKSGLIINISSVAGCISLPIASVYSASKFALEGLSEGMRYELEPFGIKVVIIEPGVIGTNFMNAMVIAKKAMQPDSPYAEITQKVNSTFNTMFSDYATPPEEVAKTVVSAATSVNPDSKYLVGNDASTWVDARRKMSDEEFEQYWKKAVLGAAPQQ